MSRQSEALLSEMRDIFGDSFGGHRPGHVHDEPPSAPSGANAFAEEVLRIRSRFPGPLTEKTSGDTKGARGGRTQKKGDKTHHPFKRSSDLGPGPRGTKHKEAQCWRCSCGDIYKDGCKCVGTGATKDCPKGRVKPIKIKKPYRDEYNPEYHSWRAKNAGEVARRLSGKKSKS